MGVVFFFWGGKGKGRQFAKAEFLEMYLNIWKNPPQFFGHYLYNVLVFISQRFLVL